MLHGSSSQLFRIGLFSTSVNLHLLAGCEVSFTFFGPTTGRRRARVGPSAHMASLSHFRRTLEALLQLLASCQHRRCVSSSHSRTREHFLNLSVIAEGCNFDAVRHPSVPTNRNSLQSDGIQTSSAHCGMFQFHRKRQTTPGRQQVTSSLSRKGACFQHNRFHHVVLSRHCSLAVVVDFVCMLPCTKPQRLRCIRLVQETSNTCFRAPSLFDKTVPVQIIGAGPGVKDCVLSASRRLRPSLSPCGITKHHATTLACRPSHP